MRSAIIAAAFAATALAVPYQKRDDEKRAVVTHTEMNVVYATQYVTVTGGSEPAAATPESQPNHYAGHHWGNGKHKHAKKPKHTKEPASQPTQNYEQPEPSSEAPEHAPSSGGSNGGGSVGTSPTDYAGKAVFAHNLHRANHSAPDIKWSSSLASIAEEIANSCSYAHNTEAGGGGYGQNIAAGVASDNITAVITNLFYNGEIGYYDGYYGMSQPPMTNFEKFGHFTQIVWKGTTELGCYTKDCSSTGLANTGSSVPPYFTVCNYKSPGNFANEYGDNVLKPLGHASADWNTGL